MSVFESKLSNIVIRICIWHPHPNYCTEICGLRNNISHTHTTVTHHTQIYTNTFSIIIFYGKSVSVSGTLSQSLSRYTGQHSDSALYVAFQKLSQTKRETEME